MILLGLQCEDMDMDMDMAQLEWLSGLFDDASIPHELAFPGATCAAPIKSSALAANAGVALLPPDKMEDALFRSCKPISVPESFSLSCCEYMYFPSFEVCLACYG